MTLSSFGYRRSLVTINLRKSVIALVAGLAIVTTGNATGVAQSLPHQKLGLWQQIFTTSRTKISSEVCLEASLEPELFVVGSQVLNKACKAQNVSRDPDGAWHIASVCDLRPGWRTTNRAVVTGDFNGKLIAIIESISTGMPSPLANGSHRMTIASTWLGPCAPGQKGGNVVTGSGPTITNRIGASGTAR